MIFSFLALVAGLLILVKASDITIDRAIKLSRLTGISQMTIGFILIAVSTSLPELSIAAISSLENESSLSFGNLVGANITNLTLVFAFLAFMGFAMTKKEVIEVYEAIIFTSAIAVFIFFLKVIDPAMGLFLLILFFAFAKGVVKEAAGEEKIGGIRTVEAVKAGFYVVVSVFFVILSAKLVTDSAVAIADSLKISQSVLGATILSVGTTLPELSVNITALRKGNVPIAIGDSIGSIVTNLTLVMSIPAFVNPIIINGVQGTLLVLLVLVNAIFLLLASRMKFSKTEGVILLLVYIAYLSVVGLTI